MSQNLGTVNGVENHGSFVDYVCTERKIKMEEMNGLCSMFFLSIELVLYNEVDARS